MVFDKDVLLAPSYSSPLLTSCFLTFIYCPSHHQSPAAIPVRSDSQKDVEMVFNFFYFKAKVLGMDMNMSKTQIHALNGVPQKVIYSTRGSIMSTIDQSTGKAVQF